MHTYTCKSEGQDIVWQTSYSMYTNVLIANQNVGYRAGIAPIRHVQQRIYMCMHAICAIVMNCHGHASKLLDVRLSTIVRVYVLVSDRCYATSTAMVTCIYGRHWYLHREASRAAGAPGGRLDLCA